MYFAFGVVLEHHFFRRFDASVEEVLETRPDDSIFMTVVWSFSKLSVKKRINLIEDAIFSKNESTQNQSELYDWVTASKAGCCCETIWFRQVMKGEKKTTIQPISQPRYISEILLLALM